MRPFGLLVLEFAEIHQAADWGLRRWGDLNQIHALGYCPEPAEIAAVAAFLCSDDAKFITGYIMPVSGGSECGYNIHAPVPLADPHS